MPSTLSSRRALRALASLAALAAAFLALSGALHAPAAQASDQQLSVMMDDDLLLYRTDEVRDSTLRRMKALGVDVVRVTVLWSVVGEYARVSKQGKKRPHFKGEDPRTYPRRNWDRYDRLVRSARAMRMQVYFNVTGPGPSWAHKGTKLRRNKRAWKPKVREFYKFVAAVAKRYKGNYRDENDGRFGLPRVSIWSIWNEPNQGGWLLPQWEHNETAGRPIPTSPILYRELYFYGRKALQDNGHGGDLIMFGETAPLGTNSRKTREPLRPKAFLRELFCVDPNGVPYTGPAAEARKCNLFDKFGPFRATAFAHHPYTRKNAPTIRDGHGDSITMANIGELPNLLDQLAAATGRLPASLPVMLSEFGYESNPPDKYAGVSFERQAEFNNLGEFLAFTNPRIFGQTQFLLRDVHPNKRYKRGSKAYYSTYQSGLYTRADNPKPAAKAYGLPFVLYPTGRDEAGTLKLHLWGQLRFRPNRTSDSSPIDNAQVQFKPDGGTTWSNFGEAFPVPNAHGFFETDVLAAAPGSWRIAWGGPQAPFFATSREIRVVP